MLFLKTYKSNFALLRLFIVEPKLLAKLSKTRIQSDFWEQPQLKILAVISNKFTNFRISVIVTLSGCRINKKNT